MTDETPETTDVAPWEAYQAAQIREYSLWVANGPIYIGGALAFAADHPVPASHVERYKFDELGLVRPANTEEA